MDETERLTEGPDGRGETTTRRTTAKTRGLVASAAEAAAAAACGARLVTALDSDFPVAAAAATGDTVLVVRGRLPERPAVAIVGSRWGNLYGCEAAQRFARYLAAAGVTVISGLAHGVDAAAHRGALSAPAGTTVAVLGCGVAADYPSGHRDLAEAIAAHGAVVSQFPTAATPRAWHFPVRNRLIAALAQATLVVQATPRSGALSTARLARQLGRQVFALPGPVFDPLSWGPHALLRSGATVASHPEDILRTLVRPASISLAPARPMTASPPSSESADPPEAWPAARDETEAAVLAVLRGSGPRTATQIAACSGLAPAAVLGALLDLELAGMVLRRPGMVYRAAAM